MTDDPELRAEIFEAFPTTFPAFTRKAEVGPPPPADAPVEGYAWNDFRGFWEESDAQLRARMKAKTFPIRPVLGRVIIRIETSGEKVSDAGVIMNLDSERGAAKREGTDRVGVVVAFDEGFYESPRNASYQEPGSEDGPGAFVQKQNRPDIKLGDRVFFAVSWAGESFEYEGELYHVLEGEDAAVVIGAEVTFEALTR